LLLRDVCSSWLPVGSRPVLQIQQPVTTGIHLFFLRAIREICHCLLPGGIISSSTCTAHSSGRPENTPVLGSQQSSPILPASRSSTPSKPAGVLGPAGLSPTKTPMVVGAPRSYRALRASAKVGIHHPTVQADTGRPVNGQLALFDLIATMLGQRRGASVLPPLSPVPTWCRWKESDLKFGRCSRKLACI